MDDALERAWADLEARWEDEELHRRFVALGDATDRLAEVARRYRAVKDEDAGRAAVCQRWLDEITARALGRMSAAPRDPVPTRRPIEWIALGVSVALGAAALWQMLRVM